MQKKGEGLYLIAWSDDKPIGHFLLRWSGPQDDRVTRHVDVTRSAFPSIIIAEKAWRRRSFEKPSGWPKKKGALISDWK